MTNRTFVFLVLGLAGGVSWGPAISAQEKPEFSGPQVGEKLLSFSAKGVLGEGAGKEFDLVKAADGKAVAILFVHEVNRPSVGLARAIGNYAASRKGDGLTAGLVLLSADPTKTEEWAKIASYALPEGIPVGISTDGQEGPGAYGLNRKVTMTVLVGKEGKVTANFALVQPSLQADGPKIAQAICDCLGSGKAPTAEELQKLVAPAPASRKEPPKR